ncbi:hypothetical protein PHYSODRAFT_531386 [Phytophthora sojae]|uniref:Histone-lysine N-methyltransferase, H3 lysine-79 specific n=1 Tax=Phytophthora sojae (strain P6497) TaxID=1094619 RepID=G5AE75_PHYSP|nr:hypothetical protein PHYSODRAFT_531386 [Phytophthora sojae]EGZ06477.1 hypothetical protein PHYSODRAFT_531386 [Phytophthora sojae]|eukprot:XP_009538374.1 hypothetical protein PHYSODRAFT_531386 [Phytophthora sojae]
MAYCGKTQRQLQIRLKTLKRTHGVSLNSFPRRFRDQKSARTRLVGGHKVSAPDNVGNVHDAVSIIPTLSIADTFVDFGSRIGNVVAQVALETCVGRCIGIEFQDNLANMSKLLIRGARVDFPNLSKVTIHEADLRAMRPAVREDIDGCSVLFVNNIVFEPTSFAALGDFASSAAGLVLVVVMATVCGRHRPTCPRNFCSVWTLRQRIDVQVSWSSQLHHAYWYTRVVEPYI